MNGIHNAVIKGTMLGREDHGVMTCFIYLDYGGSQQAFGGYGLDEWFEAGRKRVGIGSGIDFISAVLKVVDVDTWERLSGRPVRVKVLNGNIISIGHYLREEWFTPSEFFSSSDLTK